MPAIRLAELHPIIVHFPIALLITAVVMDFLAVALKRWHLVYGASWILTFGVVGALVAGITGNISERTAHTAAVAHIFALHKEFAFATGFTFVVLLGVRLLWLMPDILGALAPRFAMAGNVAQTLRQQLPGLWTKRLSPAIIGIYLLGSVVGVVLLGLTGYYGGAMVYDHGVGTPNALLALPFGW